MLNFSTTEWDHPRVCGEKTKTFYNYCEYTGSPPRVRGKAAAARAGLVAVGITPACAGKRRLSSACTWQGGSPPRVRGKGHTDTPIVRDIGITPACAGKRSMPPCWRSCWRDHPRVCGEKHAVPVSAIWSAGSPPRVRGKAPSLAVLGACIGITPACAGKRLKRSHRIGHFSCILCLFHSVLHRASASGGSRAGPCAPPCLPAQNAVPV